jgi:hypothetical protein
MRLSGHDEMQETTYRGFRIRYHCLKEWFAHIHKPFSVEIVDTVLATVPEGKNTLLRRACARIDREID